MTRIIKCATCRKSIQYDDNPYRPFCSQRCQMADLGHWAEGDYRVDGGSADVSEESPSFESTDSEC